MALGAKFKWYAGRVKDEVANFLDNAGAVDMGLRIPAAEANRVQRDARERIATRNAKRQANKPV